MQALTYRVHSFTVFPDDLEQQVPTAFVSNLVRAFAAKARGLHVFGPILESDHDLSDARLVAAARHGQHLCYLRRHC